MALDFSKAFDTVPHHKLLEAVKKANITKKAGRWVQSWLQHCSFEVKIEDKLSTSREMRSGVKQGSCLGPLAFIIFLNPLLEKLNNLSNSSKQSTTYGDLSSRVHVQAYAEDITFIVQFPR